MASKDALAKFHATEISKTTARKELDAYKSAGGNVDHTFGKLKKETNYACAMTDKAKSAASSAGKAVSTVAGATAGALSPVGTVASGALEVASNAVAVAAFQGGDALKAVTR